MCLRFLLQWPWLHVGKESKNWGILPGTCAQREQRSFVILAEFPGDLGLDYKGPSISASPCSYWLIPRRCISAFCPSPVHIPYSQDFCLLFPCGQITFKVIAWQCNLFSSLNRKVAERGGQVAKRAQSAYENAWTANTNKSLSFGSDVLSEAWH